MQAVPHGHSTAGVPSIPLRADVTCVVKPGPYGDDEVRVWDGGWDGALPAGRPPVSASPVVPVRGDTDAVTAWISAAEAFDRFDLSLRLRSRPRPAESPLALDAPSLDLVALERELTVRTSESDDVDVLDLDDLFGPLRGPGGAATAVDLAVAMLLTDRLPDAVTVLRLAGVWADPGPDARARAVVAACRAAGGDAAAYARLLTADAGDPVLTGYLQAAAAVARGDVDLADQAWTRVVEQGAPVSDHSYPHWAAAVVARRSRVDDAAATATVRCAAAATAELAHDVRRHPAPVVRAVEVLRARGDEAGALLLTLAVDRLHPGVGALRDLLSPVEPRAWRRLVRRGRVAGLGLVDSRVWWRLLSDTVAPGSGGAPRRRGRRDRTAAAAALARADELSRCVCLRSSVLVDDDAVAYAQHHLRPARLGSDAVSVLRGVGSGAWLGSCPLTGIEWLGVDVAPGEAAWLARGAVPREARVSPARR